MTQQRLDLQDDDLIARYAEKAESLQEAVHFCVMASPLNAQQIAHSMGVEYKHFMRKVDPSDEGAQFGVQLLERLMEVCGNDIPFRYLDNRQKKTDEQRFREKMERIAQSLPSILEAVNWVKEERKAMRVVK